MCLETFQVPSRIRVQITLVAVQVIVQCLVAILVQKIGKDNLSRDYPFPYRANTSSWWCYVADMGWSVPWHWWFSVMPWDPELTSHLRFCPKELAISQQIGKESGDRGRLKSSPSTGSCSGHLSMLLVAVAPWHSMQKGSKVLGLKEKKGILWEWRDDFSVLRRKNERKGQGWAVTPKNKMIRIFLHLPNL